MRNVKTNQMNARRCNSKGAGVKMTSWLNNNFRLLALTLLAVLSVNVWGATGDVTVNVAYNDFPDGYASSGTSGSFSKTVSSSNDLTIYYSGVNTRSEKGGSYSYGYDMFLKNQGFAYSGAAPTGYYPSRVTVTFSSGTGTSGKAGINFGASSLSSRNSSVTGSVSKSGTCTASNSDQTKVYWNFSTTGANVQVQSMTIVYSKTSAPSCTTNPTVSAGAISGATTSSLTFNCSGGITSLGSTGCSITEYGYVYGTSSNPTTSSTKYKVGESYTTTGTAFAAHTATGLNCGTTYYMRPYAINGNGTAYGTQATLSTSACLVDHFIDNVQETDGYTGDGKAVSTSFTKASITLSDKDAVTSGSCEDVHYHFVGWVTEADRSAGNVDAGHIVNFQDSGNVPTGTTYYAVWAKEAE